MKSLSTVQREIYMENTARKRKRVSENRTAASVEAPVVASACFTNAAFSSTPKKLIARQCNMQAPVNIKRNASPSYPPMHLEVKSITNIAEEVKNAKKLEAGMGVHDPIKAGLNIFEVERKPPKKKKRQVEIEEACFENPALNLELPEKQFNPYEIKREYDEVDVMPIDQPKCFVNKALNLRSQDAPTTYNPFEIQRYPITAAVNVTDVIGVEHVALDEFPVPTNLIMGLSFKPTVHSRIDFKNLPLSELTPSKFLAEKLVFSPAQSEKRLLDSIGEHNSTMDIGKELDRYQLELENSINEAKLRKNFGTNIQQPEAVQDVAYHLEVTEQKVTFSQKLTQIVEDEEEAEEQTEQAVENLENLPNERDCYVRIQNAQSRNQNQLPTTEVAQKFTGVNNEALQTSLHKISKAKPEDVTYACKLEEEDGKLSLKNSTHFVRAYRCDTALSALTVSKKSLNFLNSQKFTDSGENKQSMNAKNIIRKSIRKLMYASKSSEDEKLAKKGETEKRTNIMSSMKHSLRRKPGKHILVEEDAAIQDAERPL